MLLEAAAQVKVAARERRAAARERVAPALRGPKVRGSVLECVVG
jgi:hypothetical protein